MRRASKEIHGIESQGESEIFEFGEFRVDASERLLSRGGAAIPLPPQTFEALLLLVRNRGHLLKKRTMPGSPGADGSAADANFTNAVSHLRAVLGTEALFETVSNEGYRLTAEVRTIDRNTTSLCPAGQRVSTVPESIKLLLDKICLSPAFARSRRLQRFLKYAVKCALENPNQPLKEYAIAVAVYDKDATFDPQTDPIIRVEASRLRSRLLEYYAGAGIEDRLVIDFPKGRYLPLVHPRTRDLASSEVESIAVIPCSDIPDAELCYLTEGISEGLTRRLAQIESLRVAPWSMVLRSREHLTDFSRTAQYLNVRTLLILRLVERGGTYEVHAEWIDPERKAHLWGNQYRRNRDEIHGLEDEIAVGLAPRIAPDLTSIQIREIGKQYTTDGRAYQQYLKGRHLWNKRTHDALTKAIQYYRRALDHDPGYALAFAGMADSYLTLGTFAFIPPADSFPQAKAAAARALELDRSLGEARTILACLRAVYEWDWESAECDFQQAIATAPKYPVAPQWYGAVLCATGRFAEGRKMLERAVELDPLSAMIGTQLGVGYYVQRRYDDAIRQFTKVLDLEPHFWAAFHFLGLCYLASGGVENAILNARKAAELSGDTPFALAGLGCVLARVGKKDDAAQVLSNLELRSGLQYVPSYSLALICCGLERRREALGYLEEAQQERSPSIALWLGVEPLLDPLRSEPRFQRLIQSARLTRASPLALHLQQSPES